MGTWYSRPVLSVADVERAMSFYVDQLGFSEAWHHDEGGRLLVAQVDKGACELILSSQLPHEVGPSLIFISLEPGDLLVVRRSLERQGVPVKDGWWGYRLMIVEDPDGNLLYFPVSEGGPAGEAQR